jgi:hypothetical protein
MRYFIYQITNLKNNRFYIGQHQCEGEFLDSNYYGSGTAIKRAVKKHGIQNFKREVLIECQSVESMIFMEKIYVGPELVKDRQCYNLTCGGGSFYHINSKGQPNSSWRNSDIQRKNALKVSHESHVKAGKARAASFTSEYQSSIGKGKPKRTVECHNCGKIGAGPGMYRYHFDNCRVPTPV